MKIRKISKFLATFLGAILALSSCTKNDGPITNRGINSIQLFYDQNRFYIMNVLWCAESLGFTLPADNVK